MRGLKSTHWPLTVLSGSVSLLNLLLPLVLVRVLTQHEIGQYKVYFLYSALIPWLFLTAGINNGLSHWAGHEEKKFTATQSSWTILVTMVFAGAMIAFIFNRPIRDALEWDWQKTFLLVWGGFALILANFFDDASIAFGKIIRGALFSSGFDLFRTITMAVSGWYFRSVEAVLWSHAILVTIKLVVGMTWGYIEGFQRPNIDPAITSRVFRYAFPVSLAAACSIITSYSDQLLLSKILLPADFAIYSFGCLMIPPLIIFEQSVNRVLIPKMSKAFATKNSHGAMRLFQNGVSELSWILIPSAIALIVFAEPIITLLFTEKYIASAFFLQIYAIHHLINLLPYDSVARAKGNGRWILKWLAFFSIFSLVTVSLLARYFGAPGALVGAVISNFMMRSSAMWSVHRNEAWPLKQMLPWKDWARYYVFAALGAVGAVLVRQPTGDGLSWLFIGGSFYSLIYLAGTAAAFRSRHRNFVKSEELQVVS